MTSRSHVYYVCVYVSCIVGLSRRGAGGRAHGRSGRAGAPAGGRRLLPRGFPAAPALSGGVDAVRRDLGGLVSERKVRGVQNKKRRRAAIVPRY